ncbi:MAG: hypothetical protein O2894_08500 [Planctomycetota bacterium]|nr:hypothetical protein [Planctomycetota bacterium]
MFSSIIRTRILSAFCFAALLFATVVGVDAQTEIPIGEDEIVASVSVGDHVWVSPIARKTELEDVTGQVATVESLGSLLSRLPLASGQNGVRFEGRVPASDVQAELANMGYGTQTSQVPQVPGATVAVLRTA